MIWDSPLEEDEGISRLLSFLHAQVSMTVKKGRVGALKITEKEWMTLSCDGEAYTFGCGKHISLYIKPSFD